MSFISGNNEQEPSRPIDTDTPTDRQIDKHRANAFIDKTALTDLWASY